MRNSISKIMLYITGKIAFLLCLIPFLGEPLVRVLWKNSAKMFYMARHLFKSKKSYHSLVEIKDEWHSTLALFGVPEPTVTRLEEKEYYWYINACPYGYKKAYEKKVCDAIMDFDRMYVRKLGAHLEILECVPGGASKCSYVTRLA